MLNKKLEPDEVVAAADDVGLFDNWKNSIIERFSDRVVFSFLISFIVVNHIDILYLLFGSNDFNHRLAYLVMSDVSVARYIGLPLLGCVIYYLIFPAMDLLLKLVRMYTVDYASNWLREVGSSRDIRATQKVLKHERRLQRLKAISLKNEAKSISEANSLITKEKRAVFALEKEAFEQSVALSRQREKEIEIEKEYLSTHDFYVRQQDLSTVISKLKHAQEDSGGYLYESNKIEPIPMTASRATSNSIVEFLIVLKQSGNQSEFSKKITIDIGSSAENHNSTTFLVNVFNSAIEEPINLNYEDFTKLSSIIPALKNLGPNFKRAYARTTLEVISISILVVRYVEISNLRKQFELLNKVLVECNKRLEGKDASPD